MRMLLTGFTMICVALLLATNTNVAQDKKDEKKDVVLKGKITCAKCDLGTSGECETVIVVKVEKQKNPVVYIFDKASHAKYHDDICTSSKNGTVTGIVRDDGKKKVVSVKKVVYEK